MRSLSFQMFPVPYGITAQQNGTDCNHDHHGANRTAKGNVQGFIIRDDREGIEHTVKNDTWHQTLPFVEKDDQCKPYKHGKDDLANGFKEILPIDQIHNMPDPEGD